MVNFLIVTHGEFGKRRTISSSDPSAFASLPDSWCTTPAMRSM